jgi:hypothetical protein
MSLWERIHYHRCGEVYSEEANVSIVDEAGIVAQLYCLGRRQSMSVRKLEIP